MKSRSTEGKAARSRAILAKLRPKLSEEEFRELEAVLGVAGRPRTAKNDHQRYVVLQMLLKKPGMSSGQIHKELRERMGSDIERMVALGYDRRTLDGLKPPPLSSIKAWREEILWEYKRRRRLAELDRAGRHKDFLDLWKAKYPGLREEEKCPTS